MKGSEKGLFRTAEGNWGYRFKINVNGTTIERRRITDDDAEAYMSEFNAVREASKGEMNPYRYVLNWYEKTFPTHADVPEFDSNNRIVNYPKNYSQMDA